jgi:ankyrin repeat protein
MFISEHHHKQDDEIIVDWDRLLVHEIPKGLIKDKVCFFFSFYSLFYSSRNRNNNLEEYPLHLACQNGQIEVVGKLLQEFSPVTLEHDMNRWSPLHHAAWYR